MKDQIAASLMRGSRLFGVSSLIEENVFCIIFAQNLAADRLTRSYYNDKIRLAAHAVSVWGLARQTAVGEAFCLGTSLALRAGQNHFIIPLIGGSKNEEEFGEKDQYSVGADSGCRYGIVWLRQ